MAYSELSKNFIQSLFSTHSNYIHAYYINLDVHTFNETKSEFAERFFEFHLEDSKHTYSLVHLENKVLFGIKLDSYSDLLFIKEIALNVLGKIEGQGVFEVSANDFSLARLF